MATVKGRERRRPNILDALDERSHLLARSRTALVRVGTVASVAGNLVTVNVGGGTVDAVSFMGQSALAAGNVVAVITDTDAWWILGRLS